MRAKAASGVIRDEASSMPLQSGNSKSKLDVSIARTDPSDFCIEFFGPMFEKNAAHYFRINIQAVSLHQLYHVLDILQNSTGMPMPDRMAFKRQ